MPFHLHIISYHITSCGVVSCPRERSSNRRSVEVIFRSFTPPTHPQNDQRFYFIHPHHYNRAEQVSLICGRCLCAINRHSSNKDDGEVEDKTYPALFIQPCIDPPIRLPFPHCQLFHVFQTSNIDTYFNQIPMAVTHPHLPAFVLLVAEGKRFIDLWC